MRDELWGVIDLLRQGYFDSDEALRVAMRRRRLPKPFRVMGKLKWKRTTIEAWFANGTICWIPRTRGQP